MVAAMATMVIRANGIGRAVQMFWNHLNALQRIHFIDSKLNPSEQHLLLYIVRNTYKFV